MKATSRWRQSQKGRLPQTEDHLNNEENFKNEKRPKSFYEFLCLNLQFLGWKWILGGKIQFPSIFRSAGPLWTVLRAWVRGQFLKPEALKYYISSYGEAAYLRTYYECVVIYISWSKVEKQIPGVPKEMSRVFQILLKNARSQNWKLGYASNRF